MAFCCAGDGNEDFEGIGDDLAAMKREEGFLFDVKVTKLNGSFGMSLDYWNIGLQILAVKQGGGAFAYNRTANEDTNIQKYDFIMAVNGSNKLEAMEKALGNKKTCIMTICRPARIEGIQVHKNGRPLGLKTSFWDEQSHCIQVEAINHGAAAIYNEVCPNNMRIQVHDFVISVNGHMGIAEDLIQKIAEAEGRVDLVVLRVVPDYQHSIAEML